jgi:hypothetical protein
MKKVLSLLLLSALSLFILNSCTSDKSTQVTPKGFENTRSIRTANSSTVICHNCRAKFKLSTRIQKLVGTGNAEVECPVCHRNYITGRMVKH